MWDQIHWPIVFLLAGIALHLFRRGDKIRSLMFFGFAVAVLGREHLIFTIVGAVIVLASLFVKRPTAV
jgi:hypothetical protein